MASFLPQAISIGYIDARQMINLALATATNIGALYLVVVYSDWTRRLRYSRTSLRPLIFSLALAKGTLWFWTGSNVFSIVVLDNSQPLITLPARLLWLAVVLIQVWVTVRVKPAPLLPASLERELFNDGRMVLIVDDVEPFARMCRKTLEMNGINAEFATSGFDALTMIELERPRLMVVDLGLPDMDGVQFVRRARELGFEGPVIAVSGAVGLFDMEKLAPAGFVEILTKPFRTGDFVGVVHRCLQSS